MLTCCGWCCDRFQMLVVWLKWKQGNYKQLPLIRSLSSHPFGNSAVALFHFFHFFCSLKSLNISASLKCWSDMRSAAFFFFFFCTEKQHFPCTCYWFAAETGDALGGRWELQSGSAGFWNCHPVAGWGETCSGLRQCVLALISKHRCLRGETPHSGIRQLSGQTVNQTTRLATKLAYDEIDTASILKSGCDAIDCHWSGILDAATAQFPFLSK